MMRLRQGAAMRGGIDAARHARDDNDACLAEPGGKIVREPPAIGRGVAGPDHGDDGRGKQFVPTEQRQDRRCVFDRGEPRWVCGFAPADKPRADARERRQLLFGSGTTRDGDIASPETRHRFDSRPRRSETAQQGVEGDRTDRFGAA